eukprot:scaffold109182_cov71-Phaeocystis_antarctica.AAC.1
MVGKYKTASSASSTLVTLPSTASGAWSVERYYYRTDYSNDFDRLFAPPLPIISSTLTHAPSRAGGGNWHRWRELNLPWVILIDDRPTPTCSTK